jgi:hypothetical protein
MPSQPNWKDPRYLAVGTSRQRHTYTLLAQLGILTTLRRFDPVVAGTIPLGIDLPDSDIDVICEVALADVPTFEQQLRAHYGHLPAFRVGTLASGERPALVSSFRYAGVEIEVFGQALPTAQQYAFRHLAVEHAVLKQQGLKTEPAFAALLHLPGNPYEALLTLENLPPAELAARVAQVVLPRLGPGESLT